MDTQLLKGKVALVTGGSSGIGFGTAKRLAEEGAFVYITGRRKEVLEQAAAKLGNGVKAVQADISNKEDMLRLANIIKEDKGGLDIIFANAGGGKAIPFEEATEADYRRTFDVNVWGTYLTVQTLLPILRDGASIILNASITAYMGLPGFGLYAATKAAVRSFARSWTTDLKSRGIRVNAVSPGVIPTEGYEVVQGMSTADVQAYTDRVSSEIPLGRVGTSEELGDAVVFLASDLSKYITGIELTVDGGMTQVYAGKN
ncbi:SDR family oxidoreductase [Phocaeicola coprocola]|uniref:SDR family oxidoreductase n=1 Tax=Phocaeicola coprocola TaxID=310298 RepID=UPI002670666C|nr:SDR family oxidoreductase [Phocaeicola coprocola]